MDAIQTVDLQKSDPSDRTEGPAWARALLKGLQEHGFVRVVGHDIPQSQILRAREAFERFFELPDAEKNLCGGSDGGQRGFTPFGLEHARDQTSPDQKEFFHIGQADPPSDPPAGTYSPNIWPESIPELREAGLVLYRSLEDTASRLLQGLALACQLPAGTFSDMIKSGNSILRAVHYPPLQEGAPSGSMRAAPHEDINLITLVCGETDAGLEILDRQNNWVPIPTTQEEIVADVGDMLARVTNNTLRATTHRVVARGSQQEKSRYSLPFFAHPRPECDLSVLRSFLSGDEEPLFPPIDAAHFLEERLREIGLL
ncbi:MAG: 2-oxoglutarate and iron-dependent oxygenase domain-containing protein [Myxococcota bacterium]|nr:2-oxoglutarate and iron-dependent oxygenase domain-containing protein [Myxococcota bacterium]